MSVKERLKEYIKSQGLTTQAWEKSINASNGYVNSITKGIGEEKIQAILEKYFNINFDWLMTGRGPMTIEYLSDENSFPIDLAKEDSGVYNEIYWRGRYDELLEQYEKLKRELSDIKSRKGDESNHA